MKRLAILFCVLALLLTACTLPTAPETTQAPTFPGTAQTAEATELPTQAGAEAPTESPVTEPPAPGYSAGGAPTAGGVVVWTDPSVYRPYSGPEAKYTRLREGPLDHFEPSDDYGAVYPYAAARLFTSWEDGESWEAGATYGLVDAAGRLLTDGIYSTVEPLTEYDYDSESSDSLPYWVVSTVERVETVTEGEDGELYTYIDGEASYGLISMDGSFMLPIEYRGISVLGDGFRCIREWDDVSFEVYDSSGRLLFTGADLVRDSGFTGATVTDGGEGLYLIELYDKNWHTESWFCDGQGRLVLGPFEEAEAFCEGLACVTLDRERYGYIDPTGAWILEPQYTDYGSFRNGRAIHSTEDGSTVIIDTAGKVLRSFDPKFWVYREACGFRADSGDDTALYYDLDGQLLFSGDSDLYCLDKDTFLGREDEAGSRIFRLNGPSLEVPAELYSFSDGMCVLDGKAAEGYLVYGYSEDDEKRHDYFIPRDLSGFYRIDNRGKPTPDTYRTNYTATDECTNETWCLCWNGEAWEAVNRAGEIRLIPLRVRSLTLRGDRIMAVTDRACVYVDWEGNLLFSYPLDDQD